MQRLALTLSLSLLAIGGCSKSTKVEYDAGADFAVPRKQELVGKEGVTCCMTTSGADFVMYLLDPVPGVIGSNGVPRPANGELHITNAHGADFTLGSGVPVFGYAFSPDGRFAMFISKAKENYSLNFATLVSPDFKQPLVTVSIPDGLQDYQLFQQGYFSPSGRYFIVGVLPSRTKNSPDRHVVDMIDGKDVYQLDKGAFSYFELTSPDDVLVFQNSTASTVAGVTSVQGLYSVPLSAAILAGIKPQLIDTRVGPASLMGDGVSVIYLKHDATLWYYDLQAKYHVKLADKALSFNLGPERRGPIVWVGTDGSLHVTPKLGAETFALPAGNVDPFSTIAFAPDNRRIYYFKHMSSQDRSGEMWSVNLADGSKTLIGPRVSTVDQTFVRDRMLTIQACDGRGDFGELTSSRWDDSDKVVIARGAQLGGLRMGFPQQRPMGGPKDPSFAPPDLLPPGLPPIIATLTGGVRESGNSDDPINESLPLIGTLTIQQDLKSLGRPLGNRVHAGAFRFSDDGYAIAAVKDTKWDDGVLNYVGTLDIQATLFDIAQVYMPFEGVSEVSPIVDRQLFVNAPAAAKPGVYFIKY
jgi:hypothetical protein